MKKLRGWACLALILVMAFAASCHSQAATASEKKVFTYLTDEMGLSPAAACGIMGNIQAESRFYPQPAVPEVPTDCASGPACASAA